MNTLITGHTALTALLGSPVSHSLSPMMHNQAFRLLGLDYCYLCFDVTEDTLETAVKGLVACNIRGFNLTMPNKTKILSYLDALDPAAALIGAVNTVVNENGRLIGYNTDGYGFVRSMAEKGVSVQGKEITVLGAGGAATSIITQLALDGASCLHVCLRSTSRFYSRMEALAQGIQERGLPCQVLLHPMEEMPEAISNSQILINATSVGMEGQQSGSLVAPSLLRRDLFVADIIYQPRKTQLLLDAQKAGCEICNGLYMLLYQGAKAFTLWTGEQMPVEEIKKSLFSD